MQCVHLSGMNRTQLHFVVIVSTYTYVTETTQLMRIMHPPYCTLAELISNSVCSALEAQINGISADRKKKTTAKICPYAIFDKSQTKRKRKIIDAIIARQ